MSNRGVRGVRVVGPGSRPSGRRPADHSTDDGTDDALTTGQTHTTELTDDDAAAQEAAAMEAIGAVGADAVTSEHPGTVADGAAPTRTAASGGRRWPMRLATSVAVLGLAGTIGFGVAWHNLDSQQGNVATAKKQAQNYIIALTNFDPKGLDNEISKITSYATGNFKTSISQFFSKDVRNSLLSSNAASRGQVRAIYPQSNSGGHVTFFAVVDDTLANNKLSAPASDEIDMTVDMVNTSQGWRVANNTFLQSPLFSPTQSGGGSTPSSTPHP
jgi:hypothetical protein